MDKEKIKVMMNNSVITGKKIVLFMFLVLFGYFLSESFHYVKSHQPEPAATSPKTKCVSETSVSVNERGELLILDRTSGEYQIYEDSFAIAIFTVYANDMEAKYKNKH